MFFFLSGELNVTLIPSSVPSTTTQKLFLQLSALDDELLSIPKVITFLAKALSRFHVPALSSVIS